MELHCRVRTYSSCRLFRIQEVEMTLLGMDAITAAPAKFPAQLRTVFFDFGPLFGSNLAVFLEWAPKAPGAGLCPTFGS